MVKITESAKAKAQQQLAEAMEREGDGGGWLVKCLEVAHSEAEALTAELERRSKNIEEETPKKITILTVEADTWTQARKKMAHLVNDEGFLVEVIGQSQSDVVLRSGERCCTLGMTILSEGR